METKQNKPKGRIIEGVVASAKQMKTVIVVIDNPYRHPLYKKIIRRTSRIAAHNELEGIEEGMKVRIQEVRPMSKTKHFIVIEKV